MKHRRIFRLGTWEEREERREEREGLEVLAFNHQHRTENRGEKGSRDENGRTENAADQEREGDGGESRTL